MRSVLKVWLSSHGLGLVSWLVPAPGLVYAVVVLVFGFVFWRRAREASLGQRHVINLWMWGGVGAVIGARFYWLVVNGQLFQLPFRQWFSLSGTASWGTYLGAFTAGIIYCRLRRIAAWPWFDMAVTIGPLADAIGRWACWLAGDDFGKVSQLPWAIRFPRGSYAWTAHLQRGLIPATADWSLPVHPQQFYLMINAWMLFFLLSAIWRRFRNRGGVTFAAYLVCYGVTRFFVEFFRDPAAGGAESGLSTSQWMCVIMVVVGIPLLLQTYSRHEPVTA